MKIAILGTVGVPGRYGGFETLAENLVRYADSPNAPSNAITVYCSTRVYPEQSPNFLRAHLRYSRFNANGIQSIPYDILTSLDAIIRQHDVLLLLGVSGALALPIIRLLSNARIVTNIDGIEWQRNKWKGLAKHFLRWSEKLAVRYSHSVIADNKGIADYVRDTYGIQAEVIAYGGDHAISEIDVASAQLPQLPSDYALALCRIEPENNVEMILQAFTEVDQPLVFVGNWESSNFGRQLRARFGGQEGMHLLDPIYETGPLYHIRRQASFYVHGHSAGGTNPSLVEMMHFGIPILTYDCNFNRYTTDNQAAYFKSANELASLIDAKHRTSNGDMMKAFAQKKYCWDEIGRRYFSLLHSTTND